MLPFKAVNIIPYKIFPANLGGEKCVAFFNQYVGKYMPIVSISTQNNEVQYAKNFKMLNILSNSRIRYINPLLYFKIRKLIKKENATHLFMEHPYFGWLAWLIKKTMPVTWVIHSHNIEFERSRSIGRKWWILLKWYETWVYKQADINFFISDDDRTYAESQMNIDPKKCFTITYGVEMDQMPNDLDAARKTIETMHQIGADEKILLFNGALYHHTNYDALSIILENINPVLLQSRHPYKILVCGKGLPDFFNDLKDYQNKNVIYAGFVKDIDLYFKAADIFLNPIISGGGIKTKAVEAIAHNCTVISTTLGAMGINRAVCNESLQVVDDLAWDDFAQKTLEYLDKTTTTPDAFYEYYDWDHIAQKVISILKAKNEA